MRSFASPTAVVVGLGDDGNFIGCVRGGAVIACAQPVLSAGNCTRVIDSPFSLLIAASLCTNKYQVAHEPIMCHQRQS
jgi:hypothetical protein